MHPYATMALAALAAMGITAVLGYVFIPWLHKLKFGQMILDIGPSWHKHKQGTPTMGGLMFICGILLSLAAAFAADALLGGRQLLAEGFKSENTASKLFAGVVMALGFGVMGALDDYVKHVKKRNEGLTIVQKSLIQIPISLGYLASLWLAMDKAPYTLIPFVGKVNLSWFFWFFGFAVIYATVNTANFTDGLDGLCSGVTLVAGAGFVVFAVLRGMLGVGVAAAAVTGGCAGFLVWNRKPAKVMMGDTGSNFLGGLMVALSFALDTPVILLLMCIIYVIEGLSDVIQIGYYKLTGGRRIFKMAPIHHHFEMSGWSEQKIGVVFSLINVAGAAAGVAVVWYGLKAFIRM